MHIFFTIWAVIGCILIGIGAWYLLRQMTTAITVIVAVSLGVFILRAPVDWMESKGLPRWAGVLISYLIGLTIITVFGLIVIPIITEQLIGLISLVPGYVNRAGVFFTNLYQRYGYLLEDSNISQIVGSLASMLSEWAGRFVTSAPSGAITIGTNLITAILVFVISIIAGFWVIKDLPTIKLEVNTLISPRYRADLTFIATALSKAIGGYLRGMLIAGSCVGLIAGIGFFLLGMPYPALLGFIAGIMIFIPIFGPWLTGFTVLVIGLFISPLTGLLAVVVHILACQLTDNLITPRVMSTTVELHPAVILVGVLAGGALAGIPGLLAAIPLLAASKSIFVYFFEKRSGRKISHPKGAIFKSKAKNVDKTETAVTGAIAAIKDKVSQSDKVAQSVDRDVPDPAAPDPAGPDTAAASDPAGVPDLAAAPDPAGPGLLHTENADSLTTPSSESPPHE
jgi:predicted PurR-regulated permease PerM